MVKQLYKTDTTIGLPAANIIQQWSQYVSNYHFTGEYLVLKTKTVLNQVVYDSPKPLSHAQSLTEILNLLFKILLTLTIAAILQKGNFLKQHLSPHKCPLFLKQQVFP